MRILDSSSGLPRTKHDKSIILQLPFYLGGLLGAPVLNFLSFRVQDNSSVTLFGMFDYDSKTDTFQATELSSLFAGGVSELRRFLTEKIDQSQQMHAKNLGLTLLFASVGLTLTFLGLKRGLQHLLKPKKAPLQYEKLENITNPSSHPLNWNQKPPECLICMENVADVVLSPCNHMLMCQPCSHQLSQQQVSS